MRLLGRGPVVVESIAPRVTERQVARALRIPRVATLGEIAERGVRDAARRALEQARPIAEARGVFRTARVEERLAGGLVAFGSRTLLAAPSVAKVLAEAREVTLLVVTLGQAWDEALDRLAAQNEPAEAWFLDAIGTLYADAAAREVEARVARDMAREGLVRTRRHRPGYGDWSIEAQRELCDRVEASRIGVTVNEACAMLPRKTVSGIVGWAPG